MRFLKTYPSLITAILLSFCTAKADTNIFVTGFESSEGYVAGSALVGQQGWIKDGTGGNGIETGWTAGQSAYIGRTPAPPSGALFLWPPVNYDPVAAGTPVVKFSVKMAIEDSSNGQYDSFSWVLWNMNGDYLFEINFDNGYLEVFYGLDNSQYYVDSGVAFVNATTYTLTVTMDFGANTWGASLNNTLIATNQPISGLGNPLTLADMDATWLIWDTTAPGNNAMLFDDYTITAITATPPPPPAQPTIKVLSKTATDATLRVSGENGRNFAIDSKASLGGSWTPLTTNTCSGGYFDAVDTTVTGNPVRFYRARWVP